MNALHHTRHGPSSVLPITMASLKTSFLLGRVLALVQRPFFLYAISWSALLTTVVLLVSFAPELAFVNAVSPSSGFSKACNTGSMSASGPNEASFRLPMEDAGDVLCVPANLVRRSRLDFVVPPLFAALVVAGSAGFVHAMGLCREPQ
ncbi:hypothetical protein EJ110_NYTH45401 [Nymphaea thermarum]|nr:hypothetical protein EJ110_NYTH45401 [Nymphaea thermarum]